MSYIYFSLLAALFYSLAGISGKFATKHRITNLYSLLFWVNITALFFTPFLWLKSGVIQNPISLSFFLFILAFSCASILMWKAIYKIDVSIIQSLFNSQTIFVAILSYILLHEKFSTSIYFSIGLMVLGAILISFDEKSEFKSLINKNILLMLLAIVIFAFSDILVKKSLNTGLDIWNFKAWSIVGLATIFFPLYFLIPRENKKITLEKLKPLFLNNAFLVMAHLSIYYAFQSNVTISQAIAMIGSLFTLTISAIASKFSPEFLEHHSTRVYFIRTAGSIVLITAVILIMLTKK